ncbi:hypothetical protein [Clostridium sp.]|uniref:hypothetical protein n=1 Tax=Clostridium sp. TaxID=1506 RepID=UPI002FCC0975
MKNNNLIQAVLLTILIYFLTIYGVYGIMAIFHNPSSETLYVSFFIVIIFVILYCTLTVLEKLDSKK